MRGEGDVCSSHEMCCLYSTDVGLFGAHTSRRTTVRIRFTRQPPSLCAYLGLSVVGWLCVVAGWLAAVSRLGKVHKCSKARPLLGGRPSDHTTFAS